MRNTVLCCTHDKLIIFNLCIIILYLIFRHLHNFSEIFDKCDCSVFKRLGCCKLNIGMEDVDNSNWIYALLDPLSSFYTFSSCISLSDLNGDGDFKLVIADLGTGAYNMTIKVLKGTSVLQQNALLDLPTGVVSLYMDTTEPRTPAVIVASGASLYVYKNMRPYYKYNLPFLKVNTEEATLWNKASASEIDASALAHGLSNLKKKLPLSSLTTQTNYFLQLKSDAEAQEFIESNKNKIVRRETVVTCLSTIKKSVNEDDAISAVVVGTENKQVMIIDSEAYTVLQTYDVPSVPSLLNVSGVFAVDFRLFVACRDGKVYMLRKDSSEAKSFLELNSHVVGIERVFKQFMVALMDQSFSCYSMKGKLIWSMDMPCSIMCTALMDHKTKGFKAVMVGLENSEVRVFRDKNLVDTIVLSDSPQALCFGKYGRENSSLVAVLKSGALQVLVMKRTCEYADHPVHRGPPASQRVALDVPKKTQLFVDQTVRERENNKEMFQNFQSDLQLLRLSVAQMYLKGLTSGITPLSDDPHMPLKLSATIQGIGPSFLMLLTIENTASPSGSDPKFATALILMFHYSDKIYSVTPQALNLPALVPEIPYKFSVRVKCISTEEISQDTVTALVIRQGIAKPLITANIAMPVSEGVVVV